MTWRDLPILLRTRHGRRRLRYSLLSRLRPVIWPLAALYRRFLLRRPKIVVVVGSFGKTTTTRAVATALGLPGERHIGENAGVSVPIALLKIPPWARFGVLEVGIDKPGLMRGYAQLIRPDVVVVTGIGTEHGRSLGGLESTRHEKAEMVRVLTPSGLAVLNGDDPNALWMKNTTPARIVTYGFSPENDVCAEAGRVTQGAMTGTRFCLRIEDARFPASTRLLGRHMVYPVLAAIAVARNLRVDVQEALSRISSLPPTPERLKPVQLRSGALLLVDSFKAHVETVNAALDTLAELDAKRKIVILGEIEEPPGSQWPIYRQIGARLPQIASRVVFVGGREVLRSLRSGAATAGSPRGLFEHAGRDPLRAAQILQEDLRAGDLVLLKGRFSQKLERVAFALQGRAVHCHIPQCSAKPGCAQCYRLAP